MFAATKLSTIMKTNIFAFLLLLASLTACDYDVAERAESDNDEPSISSPDGVHTKGGGETSTWEDQSARSEWTTETSTRVSPVGGDIDTDTLKYLRTPEEMSTSEVKKDAIPDETGGR